MPKPGVINNPKGRPKGKANKITADLKLRIKSFLDDNFETIESDFKSLEPVQRTQFYEKLISYCVPKQSSNDVSLDINSMSELQLDQVINRIISKSDTI